ncbi:MAG: hypothetical protein WAN95_01680 [Bacteroidales bacterium]
MQILKTDYKENFISVNKKSKLYNTFYAYPTLNHDWPNKINSSVKNALSIA